MTMPAEMKHRSRDTVLTIFGGFVVAAVILLVVEFVAIQQVFNAMLRSVQ